MKSIAWAARLPVMLFVSLLASGNARAEDIKLGIVQTLAVGPAFVAQERGYFAAENFNTTLVYFDAAQPIAIAAASGDIDFGMTGMSAAFYSLAGQGVLRIIAAGNREMPGFKNAGYVVSNRAFEAGLTSLKQLAGHSVAVTQVGSQLHYDLGLVAEKYRLDLKDIRLLALQSNTNVSTAITGGQVDVAVFPVSPAIKLELLRSLTNQAASEQPDLIIWPESAANGVMFNKVADVARAVNTPILFGSANFGKFAKFAGADADRVEFKNQAFLVFPDGTRQGPYTKNRLVPFGEFMPFESYFEWPRWLVNHQRHGIAGDTPGLFRLRDGTMIGVEICWENYFSDLADRLVHEDAAMVVQLSNDADFGISAEPAQHNAASILRAVEYGRPWIQASLNGPSLIIDAHGKIVENLDPIGTSGWTVRTVSLADTTTIYERFGLLWLWVASALALIQIVSQHNRFRRRGYEGMV